MTILSGSLLFFSLALNYICGNESTDGSTTTTYNTTQESISLTYAFGMSDAPWNKCPFCLRPFFFCFIYFIISFVIYHLFDSIWLSVSPSYYAALVHVVYVFRRLYLYCWGAKYYQIWSGWTGSFSYFLAIDLFYHLCCRAVVVYAEREIAASRLTFYFLFLYFSIISRLTELLERKFHMPCFPFSQPIAGVLLKSQTSYPSDYKLRVLSFPISYRFD